MLYVIQKNSEGYVPYDFALKTIESVQMVNWLENKTVHQYALIEKPQKINQKFVPVGSLEFVFEMARLNNIKINETPYFIPEGIHEERYLKRQVEYIHETQEPTIAYPLFVKNIDSYKGGTLIAHNLEDLKMLLGNKMISEKIDIGAEYRCFIYNKRLVDIRRYSGDFDLLPNLSIINEMIEKIDMHSAYTLDVGVLRRERTVIIEVHPFVSCGLYGLDTNSHKYLAMISSGFKYLKKEA